MSEEEVVVEINAPEAPAEVTTEPEAPTEGEVEGIEALPESWQAEVRRLRSEAAERRVAAKQFEAFDRFDANDKAFLLELVEDLSSPERQGAAAERMRDVAERLLGGEITQEEAQDELEEIADDEDKPLTVKEWKAMQAKEAEEKAQAAAISEIESEAKSLGYEPNTAEWTLLMYHASQDTKGDLAKAHEIIAGQRQAIIDAWVEEQKAKGAKWITVPGAAQTSATEPSQIKNLADARKSLEARLDTI